MRDLTVEELALAPEWATHYWVTDERVMFESLSYFQIIDDGVITDRYDNTAGYTSCCAVEIKKKTIRHNTA